MLRVGTASLNQTPLDWVGNTTRIRTALLEAQKQKIQVLCLPELAISGYGCEDAFLAENTLSKSLESLQNLLPHTVGLLTCLGLPLRVDDKIYNTVCVVADSIILGFVCKQNLPNYGLFYEKRWFEPWPKNKVLEIEFNGKTYLVGDLLFEVSGLRIGFEICEDAWVTDRPAIRLHEKQVDLILNPSASPFSFGKASTRIDLATTSSRSFECCYIYANLTGNESGRLIFDGDTLIASHGKLFYSGKRFSYNDVELCSATVPAFPASNKKVFLEGIKSDFIFSHDPDEANSFSAPPLPSKKEEFSEAVSLALFDYLRKSKSYGFTLSLSGGADSSACLALCSLMTMFAIEQLGLDTFKQKLSYIPGIEKCYSTKEINQLLIHCIYQSTKNSSEATFNSAKNLAEDTNATFYSIGIDTLVNEYTSLIEKQIGRKLLWEKDDLALQNIQARVRAPSVWLLANINNHLLLTTSNRSEAAVGYCTMDGDTAGSIAPISGVDKAWLREWLIWMEKEGCRIGNKRIKIKGLHHVNTLQPSAELRPSIQTDEGDLMPYPILNKIENLAVLHRLSPLECYKILYEDQNQIPTKDLYSWVRRFFSLWSRNQWKRERYALGFHLDSYNLDPRSWCRFPVLNSGFETELIELQQYFESQRTMED